MALLGPSSVFFIPYLLSWLFIIGLSLRQEAKALNQSVFRELFAKKIWLSSSSRLDICLCLLNLVLLKELFEKIESFAFQFSLGFKMHFWNLHAHPLIEGFIATISTMLAIDFATYLSHRSMHQISWLWKIHSLHHSAEVLTPLTAYRQHPVEIVLLNIFRGLFAGFAIIFVRLLFPEGEKVFTIGGVGAGFFVYMFTVNLHHSMVPVIYPSWLRLILTSPHIHQIHHSQLPAHENCNFGVVFSFWDRLFRTYVDQKIKYGELKFGLTKKSGILPAP